MSGWCSPGVLAALGCGVVEQSWVARIHYHLQVGSSCRDMGDFHLFSLWRAAKTGHDVTNLKYHGCELTGEMRRGRYEQPEVRMTSR